MEEFFKLNTQNGTLYPDCFNPPGSHNEKIAALLTKLYGSSHKLDWLLGGLINHCFSARTDTVMISQSILQYVVHNDTNIRTKYTIGGREYKGFGKLCNDSGALIILSKGVKGNRGAAGLNQLNEALQKELALSDSEQADVDARLAALQSKRPTTSKQGGAK